MPKKANTRRRGRYVRPPPPPPEYVSPSPSSSPDRSFDDEYAGFESASYCSQPESPPTQLSKCKKPRVSTDLLDKDEDAMVEWLKENAIIYNKKMSSYKDKKKKDSLWAEQGNLLGRDVLTLTNTDQVHVCISNELWNSVLYRSSHMERTVTN